MQNIDYDSINQELDEYLKEQRFTVFGNNLALYAKKAAQILDSKPLNHDLEIKEQQIDLLEGIDFIKDYLKQLDPALEIEFTRQLTSGEIEINYTDEDVLLEDKPKNSTCYWNLKDQDNIANW